MKKQMMALLLAATMVFEGIVATPVTAWADEAVVNTNTSMDTAVQLTLDTPESEEIESGEELYYEFTPSESGYYTFYSESETDPRAELWDADENWLADNDDVFGDERDFCVFYNLEAGHSYYLKVSMVSDEGGSITVNVKKSTFYAVAASSDVTVKYEETGTLSVTAYSANGALSYRWYYYDDEEGYVPIDGATGSSYDVTGTADVALIYRCEVTDGVDTANCRFYLTLDTGLELAETDVYVTVPYEGKKTLTVEASGGAGEQSYQWYYWDDEVGYLPIEEATGSNYDVTGTADMASEYRCEVTDGVVTLSCCFYLTLDTGLTVQTESFEVVIPEGMTKTISVTASSVLDELTYEWYFYDEEIDDYILIEGATEATYTVEGNDQGPKRYRVEVRDGVRTESLEICVRVARIWETDFDFDGDNLLSNEDFATTEAVAFKIIPTEDCAYRFYSESTDGGYPYAWLSDSQLKELAYAEEYYNDENDIEFSLEYALKEGKEYYLIIGRYGTTGTHTIKADKLDFTASAKGNTDVNLPFGDTATLEVEAYSATGSLTYQWYSYDKNTGEKIEIEGATENSLNVTGNEEASSDYECEITDGTNTTFVAFELHIDTGLMVTREYENTVMVPYGGTAKLSVTASGGVGDYSYQWYYYDEKEDENVLIEDATESSYEVSGKKDMPLEYICEVSDGYMKVNIWFTVEIDTGLKVNTNCDGMSLYYGNRFTLYARATGGAGTISYQWYYYDKVEEDYVPIEGATESDFEVIARANSSYRCTITDGIATKNYDFDFDVEGSEGVTDLAEVATAELAYADVTYDGTAKKPAVTVTDKGVALYAGKDYTVAYSNNTNVGTATVTITGKGAYTGTVTKTFTITAAVKEPDKENEKKPISISGATVSLAKTSYSYDGKTKTPAVTVKAGSAVLVKDTDYTVSYVNNKNIGTATVTITGKGNYTGTVKITFKIKIKKGTTFTVGAYKYKITGTNTVDFAGLKSNKTTKVTIAKTVKIGGKTFKITSIANKALYKKSKVTNVTIGENVETIGTSAFAGCSKLKTITIKTQKLKTVGKNAFKGIKSTATIKVPSKKLNAYKKLLKGKGQSSKVKIKK